MGVRSGGTARARARPGDGRCQIRHLSLTRGAEQPAIFTYPHFALKKNERFVGVTFYPNPPLSLCTTLINNIFKKRDKPFMYSTFPHFQGVILFYSNSTLLSADLIIPLEL